jgi:DNA-binding transcriptional MerR regulator
MPDRDEEKIYYTIAEAADITRVPKYVIRFWESRFPEIRPDRKTGRRYFRQSDIDAIIRIRDLLYKHGFTIKGAKKAMKGQDADGAQAQEQELELALSLARTASDSRSNQEDGRMLTRYSFPSDAADGQKDGRETAKAAVDMAPILGRLKAIKDILAA